MFFLYKIYSFISFIIYPFLVVLLKIRLIKKKESKERWREKLGYYNQERPKGKLVWIHVASIGEMNSIINLISDLKESANILITSGTLSSSKNFEIKNLGQNGQNVAFHQFAPLDSLLCVKRFLSHFKPNLCCIVESEIWPNMIVQTHKVCKIFSLNTSLSPKSMEQWSKREKLFYWVFSHFFMIFPSSRELAVNLSKLGISNVSFVNNLKYDFSNLEISQDLQFSKDKKIVCFANIHKGEEAELLHAIKVMLKRDLYAVFIPRHVDKISHLINFLNLNNIEYILKSSCQNAEVGKLFIVDEIGLNTYFYSICTVVVMGGSFIEIGGHNIIEPAFFEKPIINGEFYFKCKEVVENFLKNEAVITCSSIDLKNNLVLVLEDENLQKKLSKNAKNCCNFYKGASKNIANIIKIYL